MNQRDRIAHHEAAHAVLAVQLGAGLSDAGIDLDSPTSADGAFGVAGVNTYNDDPKLPSGERQESFIRNLAVICAGAGSDAKLKGISIRDALEAQAGDHGRVQKLLRTSPLIDRTSADKGLADEQDALIAALQSVETAINTPRTWNRIAAVASAALKAGGKLTRAEIESIINSVVV